MNSPIGFNAVVADVVACCSASLSRSSESIDADLRRLPELESAIVLGPASTVRAVTAPAGSRCASSFTGPSCARGSVPLMVEVFPQVVSGALGSTPKPCSVSSLFPRQAVLVQLHSDSYVCISRLTAKKDVRADDGPRTAPCALLFLDMMELVQWVGYSTDAKSHSPTTKSSSDSADEARRDGPVNLTLLLIQIQ